MQNTINRSQKLFQINQSMLAAPFTSDDWIRRVFIIFLKYEKWMAVSVIPLVISVFFSLSIGGLIFDIRTDADSEFIIFDLVRSNGFGVPCAPSTRPTGPNSSSLSPAPPKFPFRALPRWKAWVARKSSRSTGTTAAPTASRLLTPGMFSPIFFCFFSSPK